jgi:hypothetical protein
MALPKNDPTWVAGLERMYRAINVRTTPNVAKLRECWWRKDFEPPLCFMQLLY